MAEKKKKGDLLNQLAIITDLIENANLEKIQADLIFSLDDKTFNDSVEYFSKKDKKITKETIKDNFTISIGEVNIIFLNKNSV